jgi:DNA-binding response OmpR family regulator
MSNETRILILDDEIDLLDTLTSYLRDDCQYRVYPAARAEDAITCLRRDTVDLAIVDVGAHGLRVAREAMSDGIPTILISGAPVILESGPVGEVMRKPFSLAALRRNIERAIGGQRIGSTATKQKSAGIVRGRLTGTA